MKKLLVFCLLFLSLGCYYWFSQYKIKLPATSTNRVKVLVLSYSRSGSSLLGDLLSLSPSSSYYFEPLRRLKLKCRERLNNTEIQPLLETIIGGLLDCRPGVYNRSRPQHRILH